MTGSGQPCHLGAGHLEEVGASRHSQNYSTDGVSQRPIRASPRLLEFDSILVVFSPNFLATFYPGLGDIEEGAVHHYPKQKTRNMKG